VDHETVLAYLDRIGVAGPAARDAVVTPPSWRP
jgi:hypothetical protein